MSRVSQPKLTPKNEGRRDQMNLSHGLRCSTNNFATKTEDTPTVLFFLSAKERPMRSEMAIFVEFQPLQPTKVKY